jgi:hypothetical protein
LLLSVFPKGFPVQSEMDILWDQQKDPNCLRSNLLDESCVSNWLGTNQKKE